MFFVLLGSAECLVYEGFVWNILSEYSLNFDFRNYLKILFTIYLGIKNITGDSHSFNVLCTLAEINLSI